MKTKSKLLIASLLLASTGSAFADTLASSNVTVNVTLSFPTSCSIHAAPVNFDEIGTESNHYQTTADVDIECENLRKGQRLMLNIDSNTAREGNVAYMHNNEAWRSGVEVKSGATVYEYTSSTHAAKKTITVPLQYHLKFDDVRKMQQQMINNKQEQLDINMSVPLSVSIADA